MNKTLHERLQAARLEILTYWALNRINEIFRRDEERYWSIGKDVTPYILDHHPQGIPTPPPTRPVFRK